MASALKRKRGTVAVPTSESSPTPSLKRAKSVEKSVIETENIPSAPLFDASKTGWDAAFGEAKAQNELAVVNGNGVNEDDGNEEGEDFEAFVVGGLSKAKHSKNSKRRRAMKAKENLGADLAGGPAWKASNPIGGRMLDVDPVFTEDEKFIILAHRRSIKVYSTANSLLNRSIDLSTAETPFGHIVAYSLSPNESNKIWVACNDGRIFNIDWTTGERRFWPTTATSITQMTVASLKGRDLIFTAEEIDGAWKIIAHELALLGSSSTSKSRVLYSSAQPCQILKTVGEDPVVVAASGKNVLVGALRSSEIDTVDQMRYEFLVFESLDVISSLDARVWTRTSQKDILHGRLKVSKAELKVVDVVVGDVKGALFVHTDLLGNLWRSQKKLDNQELISSIIPISLIPRKLHWHRKMVPAAKWSLDGNYIISGGSETTLVLWQIDTGHQQFLPHLSAAIVNVVVSPSGTSYAIHLADNSTMVLSTAELIPTANIAGIQAHVVQSSAPMDSSVRRLTDSVRAKPLVPRTPAVINPSNPSQLILAVGESQSLDPRSTSPFSTQYLQTFDIASNHNVSRQALTRTNVTNLNISPNSLPVSEPIITHLQISHDGLWLATVDEWAPPKRDVKSFGHGESSQDQEQQRRREVFLKFWQWQTSDETWALVNRIDAPHTVAGDNYGTGRVLGLASDASSLAFSTIGEDGVVLVWRPRTRKRDGVVVRGANGKPVATWSCQRRVSLGSSEMGTEQNVSTPIPEHAFLAFSEDGSILAAAIDSGEDHVVHILDPFTGLVRLSRPIMYRGDLISMAFLGQYLVMLSEDLRVYDLVRDEIRYGVELSEAKHSLSLEQKAAMMHLAVDRGSGTFAVALPCRNDSFLGDDDTGQTLLHAYSEIAIFSPEDAEPLYAQVSQTLATAILPAISSPGFIVIDTAAEITSLSPKATQTLISMSKPMVELRLDLRNDTAPSKNLRGLIDEPEEMDLDEDEGEFETTDEFAVQDGTDDGPPVVSQQQLARIFDVGPAFALPPMEEMFYQVADLFASKPVAQGV